MAGDGRGMIAGMRQKVKLGGLLVLLGMLAACASKPPAAVSKIPAAQLSLAEVRAEPQRFVGSEVRWGGVIASVENKASETWIEVVGRELQKDAQPKLKGSSEGRFIAAMQGFADPAVYKEGYLLTVLGELQPPVTRPIGDYAYVFPRVSVTGSYLWRVEKLQYPDYPPPWWYYDPWPFYHRPYHPYYYPW